MADSNDRVAGRVTTDGLDMVIIYFNTTSNETHIIVDDDAGADDADGNAVLIGVLDNVDSQAEHDTLTVADIISQA